MNNCCKDTYDCRPNIAEKLADMNETPYLGSFHQLLYVNIGKVVTIEYISGMSDSRCQTGIIESVNTKYVMLKSLCGNVRYVGDVFAIRFITFLCE